MASQMESAVLDQVAVDIASEDRKVIFRATGSVIAFDGFLRVYREGRDDPETDKPEAAVAADEDGERMLPEVERGESLDRVSVTPEQHFTQPPPRFTEASLVKRLEELGIGRPSTYATILSVLQERKYVRLESRRFVPEDRGRLVTAFLASFFERYVAYGFTAEMEERLDDISGGRIDWKAVLRDFWRDFSTAVEETKDLRVKEVLDALDRLLGPHFFRDGDDGRDPRLCPSCNAGRLGLRLGRFGAFIGCSNYPECRYTRPLIPIAGDDGHAVPADGFNGARVLGEDPATGLPVSLRKGPYGHYVQLGGATDSDSAADEATGETDPSPAKAKTKTKGRGKRKPDAGAKQKPKRISLPRGLDPATLDLEKALALLSLPRALGSHPETGEAINAGLGRFGPYLRAGDIYVSLKGDDDVLSIGLNRAIDLLSRARPKATAKNLGVHPADGKPVRLKAGRYGPYVEHGSMRATLPAGTAAEMLDLDAAVALLTEKAERAAPKGKSKSSGAEQTEGKRSKPPGTAASAGAPARKRAARSSPGS
jgi:DNA topoisomerase I